MASNPNLRFYVCSDIRQGFRFVVIIEWFAHFVLIDVWVTHDSYEYYMSTQVLARDDARTCCQAISGADLTSITSDDEQTFILAKYVMPFSSF